MELTEEIIRFEVIKKIVGVVAARAKAVFLQGLVPLVRTREEL